MPLWLLLLRMALRKPHRYGNLHAVMGSNSVTFRLADVTFLPLPQPELALDLAIPEGCKAESSYDVLRESGPTGI